MLVRMAAEPRALKLVGVIARRGRRWRIGTRRVSALRDIRGPRPRRISPAALAVLPTAPALRWWPAAIAMLPTAAARRRSTATAMLIPAALVPMAMIIAVIVVMPVTATAADDDGGAIGRVRRGVGRLGIFRRRLGVIAAPIARTVRAIRRDDTARQPGT